MFLFHPVYGAVVRSTSTTSTRTRSRWLTLQKRWWNHWFKEQNTRPFSVNPHLYKTYLMELYRHHHRNVFSPFVRNEWIICRKWMRRLRTASNALWMTCEHGWVMQHAVQAHPIKQARCNMKKIQISKVYLSFLRDIKSSNEHNTNTRSA